jgi:hypothetical protein
MVALCFTKQKSTVMRSPEVEMVDSKCDDVSDGSDDILQNGVK